MSSCDAYLMGRWSRVQYLSIVLGVLAQIDYKSYFISILFLQRMRSDWVYRFLKLRCSFLAIYSAEDAMHPKT